MPEQTETRSERTARIRKEFAVAEAELDAQTRAAHQAHWDAGCPQDGGQ